MISFVSEKMDFQPMFELMKMIGLKEKPILFKVSKTGDFNWLSVAAKIKKFLSIDMFLGFEVLPTAPGEVQLILSLPRDESFLAR